MIKRIFLIVLLMTSPMSYGAQVLVRPSQAGRTTDTMIFSDQTSSFGGAGAFGMQVRLNVSCFATNLRSVSNPLSPSGSVKFSVALRNNRVISIVFPGWMVSRSGWIPNKRFHLQTLHQ